MNKILEEKQQEAVILLLKIDMILDGVIDKYDKHKKNNKIIEIKDLIYNYLYNNKQG